MRYLISVLVLTVLFLFQCAQKKRTSETKQEAQPQEATAKPVPERAAKSTPKVVADTVRSVSLDSLGFLELSQDTLEALKSQFLDMDAKLSARKAACRRIIIAGGEAYLSLAEHYPMRDNHAVIRGVLDEMVQQEDLRAISLTVELFNKVQGEERVDLEVMLLKFGEASVDPLLKLLDAEDWHLVNRTMDTLGKLKSKRAVEPIIAKLQHEESWIQIKAAHSLGDIGDARAIPALMPLLKSEDYNVINAALIGLGKLKAQEAFDACMELTRHTNPRVRAVAASTLGKIGDKRAIERLNGLLNDEDKGVTALAQKALKALEP